MKVRDSILELVQQRGNVSFAQIMELEGGRGQASIECGRNVFLWTGLSGDAVRAVMALRDEGLIEYDPTLVATYAVDGHVLDMPLVESADIERGCAKPHWCPVVINPVQPKAV